METHTHTYTHDTRKWQGRGLSLLLKLHLFLMAPILATLETPGSFIWHSFIEHLLCARDWSRHQGFSTQKSVVTELILG